MMERNHFQLRNRGSTNLQNQLQVPNNTSASNTTGDPTPLHNSTPVITNAPSRAGIPLRPSPRPPAASRPVEQIQALYANSNLASPPSLSSVNQATTSLSNVGAASNSSNFSSTPIVFQNQSIINAHPIPPPVSTSGTLSSELHSPPAVRRFNNAASGPSGGILGTQNIVPNEVDNLAEYVLPIQEAQMVAELSLEEAIESRGQNISGILGASTPLRLIGSDQNAQQQIVGIDLELEEENEEDQDEQDEEEEEDHDEDESYEEEQDEYDSEQDDQDCNSLNYIIPGKTGKFRASTAPARPLTDIEQFRRGPQFLALEQAAVSAVHLIQRQDQKYDLDSYEGQTSCKKFLTNIAKLCQAFNVKCTSRDYRNKFSKAYRVLYSDGVLCYLTQILDSAQQGFPYLYVNGEKYVFSGEVLQAGKRLFSHFTKIKNVIRGLYNRVCEDNALTSVEQITEQLTAGLGTFDNSWATFEQLYISELMLIESDARRFIAAAISVQKEMVGMEVRNKAKGRVVLESTDYNAVRERFVSIIGQINAVANPEGKGRDDLQLDILTSAEGISRRVSSTQSHAVRKLADEIRHAFMELRQLFRRYDENIQIVDPQLKNNPELVEALMQYEGSWEKGKSYFCDPCRCKQLIYFSQIVQATAEKHADLKQQIDCRDSEVFMRIPCLLLLKCLDEDDDDKGLCEYFYPPMFQSKKPANEKLNRLKEMFEDGRKKASSSFDFYNIVEAVLLEHEVKQERLKKQKVQRSAIDEIVLLMKQLAIELSRWNPQEWNSFIDVTMGGAGE